MPKVKDVVKCERLDPRQVKEHIKLVYRMGCLSVPSFAELGKRHQLLLKTEKKCSKIIKKVKFEDVMHLITQR